MILHFLRSDNITNILISAVVDKYCLFFYFILFFRSLLPKCVITCSFEKNELDMQVENNYLLTFFNMFKNNSLNQFKVLSDLIVIDYPKKVNRFILLYQMLSQRFNARINILLQVRELMPVQSLTLLYDCISWYEREAWDLYGIFFKGHPDLRRILTDYSFESHPLRKGFPLSGYFEIFYSYTTKRISYKAISLIQEYRYFTFIN